MPEQRYTACVKCGTQLVYSSFGGKPKYCDEHRREANREAGRRSHAKHRETQREANCEQCGTPYTYAVRSGQRPRFCGVVCREKSLKDYQRNRRLASRDLSERKCLSCAKPIILDPKAVGQPKKHCSTTCRNRYHTVIKYGLGDGKYAAMLEAQGGGCAICGAMEPGGYTNASFHIDHCHETDKVRGLLCSSCNTGLGHYRDRPDLLRAAADYLEK